VKIEHSKHYAARMLRLLGRRDAGERLSEHDGQRLEAWLDKLRTERCVVAYAPDTEEGFFYVEAPKGRQPRVPILPKEVKSVPSSK
jgi:hypothetical protein